MDAPFGDGSRWIEVVPSGAETPIAICPPGPNVTAGGPPPFWFRDPEGNTLMVVEAR